MRETNLRGRHGLLVGLALALATPIPALAQQMIAPDRVYTCGGWLEARRTEAEGPQGRFDRAIGSAWVWGFIAHSSRTNTTIIAKSGVDGASMKAYVDRYCDANPLSTIGEAAVRLERDLLRMSAPAQVPK